MKRSRKPKPKRLAVVGFMSKDINDVSNRDLEHLLERAAEKGYDEDYFPAMPYGRGPWEQPDYGDQRDRDDYGSLVSRLKNARYDSVLIVAEKDSRALRIFMGQLVEAGMQVTLLGLNGKVIASKPGTVRWRYNKETKRSEPTQEVWGCPGEWRGVPGSLAGTWVPRRWTYEELADVEYPSETVVTMWRPSDYEGMEAVKDGRYVPLSPPAGVEYPHDLNLEGFRLCEMPLRTLDWLVGQPWLFGELRAQLLAYHATPAVQAQLERKYRLPTEEDQDWAGFMPDGYFQDTKEGTRFVSTGTAGRMARNFWYGKPVWLAVRDRYGRVLEQQGYEDVVEPRPENWVLTTPWGLDNVSVRRDPNETEDEEVLDEENLIAEECLAEEDWQDWEPRERRRIKPEELAGRWNRTASKMLRKLRAQGEAVKRQCHQAKAIAEQVSLQKELEALRRAYSNIRRDGWGLARGGEEAERNAWYEGLEILQDLEALREWMREGTVVRRTAKDEGNAREGEVVCYDLHDEAAWLEFNSRLEAIRIRVTPELAGWLRKTRETAEVSFLGRLREVRKEIDAVWERNQVRRRFPESCVRADLAVSACRDNPGFVNALAQDAPGTLRLAAWLHPGEIERLPGKLRRYESMGMRRLLTAMKRQPWHGRRPKREKPPRVQA